MDEIDTISKALWFEYYVGAKEQTDPASINQEEAIELYNQHKESTFVKLKSYLN